MRIKEYIVRNKTGFDAVFRTIATVMETKDMMVDQLDATGSDIIATIAVSYTHLRAHET